MHLSWVNPKKLKGSDSLTMEISLKVTGLITKELDEDYVCFQMELSIKENGSMIFLKVQVLFELNKETFMKENFSSLR